MITYLGMSAPIAAAAVVSDAIAEPTNTPFCQLLDWYTRGAVLARRPPNTIALTGTPAGSSNLSDRQGQFCAFAVKRELG